MAWGRAGVSISRFPALPIPSAAKYLMRRGWVHTRPKYFMRVGRDRGEGIGGRDRALQEVDLPFLPYSGALSLPHAPTVDIK